MFIQLHNHLEQSNLYFNSQHVFGEYHCTEYVTLIKHRQNFRKFNPDLFIVVLVPHTSIS